MHRWTIKELKECSDNCILRELVSERMNKLSNPYAPLTVRLQKIRKNLDDKISKERA